jgi:hypothetical protein
MAGHGELTGEGRDGEGGEEQGATWAACIERRKEAPWGEAG